MISAAVLVPHPPLLLRELGGAQDPVAALREAAVGAVKAAVAGASAVVVVGGHDEAGDWSADLPVDVRRFGTTGTHPTRPGLPASLGVGRRLLEEAGWDGPVELVAARWHAGPDPVAALAERLGDRPDGTVLLVLGDGSARRGEKAPGYLDERAFGFDDAVAAALAGGDAAALRDLDAGLAAELMVGGSTALRLLGAVAAAGGSTPVAEMTYRDDPFGVSYFVATWTF
ncbi:hypothetical protein KRR39_16115 [Nocardioides panacis]|uniref:Uncharacterized protein n=1 Tax=Nocardioides panacis TaxID=2849501 RepID=A0A975SWB3_9ACTN|nr:hypothetical protein [Nocardioides panacis]QWZ07021.1 hypothetical protein KRR39_16115 [Nocardioides panacis]